MGFGNSDVLGPLTLFGGWMPGHSWKKKNNSLFIKKWQAVECGLHKGEAGPLGQEACKCVLCCYNVESPSVVVRSLPVLTSEIVCCIFIHVIPSLFIIFMPLPLMYLWLLFMEVTPFTCGTSTSLGKGPRWSPRNTTGESATELPTPGELVLSLNVPTLPHLQGGKKKGRIAKNCAEVSRPRAA